MEKIYKVQMNSKGAPDFSTAAEIPSSDNHDWEKYSDKLWKLAYEKGRESVRPQGEWIPCSERLPEKAGHYLCSFKKANRIDSIYVDLAYWTGGRWYGYLANEINAWMPLPKPWKGADDYERAIEQMEHDMLYEPTYNPEDGSM